MSKAAVSAVDDSISAVMTLVEQFEKAGGEVVKNQNAVVRRQASQKNIMKLCGDVSKICQQSLKGSIEHLESVWGGTCEAINRLLDAEQATHVALTDDKVGRQADSWIGAKTDIETIVQVLKDRGLYRQWKPVFDKEIENLKYNMKRRIAPGQKITVMPDFEGGMPEKFEIDKELPAGLKLDPKSGNITGRVATDGFPPTTFTVTATNKSGSVQTTFELLVGPEPPSDLAYDVPVEIYVGEAAFWEPTSTGTIKEWGIVPALPQALELRDDGTIAGIAAAVVEEQTYTVTASNQSGSATCDVKFKVSAAPPLSLKYPDLKDQYFTKEQLRTTPDLALKRHGVSLLAAFARKSVVGIHGKAKLAAVLRSKAWKAAGVQFTISPDLPDGVSISPTTGVISGVPTTAQDVKTYTVTAKNDTGTVSCDVPLFIRVSAPEELQYVKVGDDEGVATPTSRETFYTGEPLRLSPKYLGVADNFVVEPALPAGLVMDQQTGEIRGIPTAITPQVTYKVTASNDMGKCDVDIIMEIQRGAPKNLQYFDVKEMYPKLRPLTLNPSYDGDNVEFSLSPALPAGVTIDPATGVISGAPTVIAPKTVYKVVAKNETGSCEADVAFSVEVLPPTDLGYERIQPQYCVREEISLDPSVEGGVDEFSIEPVLPAGMTFDTKTGQIGGSPTSETPQGDYTVTATNEGGGTSAVITFEVKPFPPSALSYSAPPEFIVEQEVLTLEPNSDNCIACTFAITPALPAGMSIDDKTGNIGGTPTAETDLIEYIVTATNSVGSTKATLSFAIVPAVPAFVDASFVKLLDEVTDISQLMEEPDKKKAFGNWMVWMVHRAWLNDPSLEELNFANLEMPPPNLEYRVAPKLMEALVTNTHMKKLLLPNANLRRQQGPGFALALSKNTTLTHVDISSNDLDQQGLKAAIESIKLNTDSALEVFRFHQNGGLSRYGNPLEEALYELMKVNHRIGTLGCTLNNHGYKDHIDKALIRNMDQNRIRRRQAAGLSSSAATAAKVIQKDLKNVELGDPSDKPVTDFFPPEDEKLTKAREFVAMQGKFTGNTTLLKNALQKEGVTLAFSEIGPLAKKLRTQLLEASKGHAVTCFDPTGKQVTGVLMEFDTLNGKGKLIVMEEGKKFSFETKKDVEIIISDKFARWLS